MASEVTSQAMARASTKQCPKTTLKVLTGEYPLKERYPDEYPKAMKIRLDKELPTWNSCAVRGNCDT
jgi:hypothetical protein